MHDEIHRNGVSAKGMSEGLIELHFLLFELFLVNIFQGLQLLEDILWIGLGLALLQWFHLNFLQFSLKRGDLKLHLLTFLDQPLLIFIDRSTALPGFLGFQSILLKLDELLPDRFVMMNGGLGLDRIEILLIVLRDKFLVEVWVLPGGKKLVELGQDFFRRFCLNLLLH